MAARLDPGHDALVTEPLRLAVTGGCLPVGVGQVAVYERS